VKKEGQSGVIMIKALLDTNVILDTFVTREPHNKYSDMIFDLIGDNVIAGYVNTSSVTDIYYILHDVQGLVAQGRTITETLEIARDVAKKLLELQSCPLPCVLTVCITMLYFYYERGA